MNAPLPPDDPGGDPPPAPPGFEPAAFGGNYIAANGPFFLRRDAQGLAVGLRVERRHCNSAGHCHGGMLATFADVLLMLTVHELPEVASAARLTPTVSLQLDYMAAAHCGDWLEGKAEVLRATRSLIFVQGRLCVGSDLVLRASGIVKLGRARAPGSAGLYTTQSPTGPIRKSD